MGRDSQGRGRIIIKAAQIMFVIRIFTTLEARGGRKGERDKQRQKKRGER